MPLSIDHYLKNLPLLTNQWNPYNYREPNRQRIYMKDIDCPQVWHDKLKETIPPAVFYLNESTGQIAGPGSSEELSLPGSVAHRSRGVARAGDLMSCLPRSMRADNLMCYIGHEGTYTPAHREMCASLGQNIMVEASGTGSEDGQTVRPGSSIWFMTETKDRHLVSEYWLSTLGHDIEVESHFAQLNAWKAAPFTTYIAEQKVGDFLLIPPLAPHQVWNRGTRTMKVAWNRTTVETLELALSEALPRARMVCRDEQYKNKAIVLFSLQKYSELLRQLDSLKRSTSDSEKLARLTEGRKICQLQKDFQRLFSLYTEILISERFASNAPPERKTQYLPFDSNITCSYCRCNIFNRFLTCTTCVIPSENGQEDTYDICMDCFVMGRSCHCLSRYKWAEQFPWQDLVEKHHLWRGQILGFARTTKDKMPLSLDEEREKLNKKTLAEICQEQLKVRPWRDPKKALTPEAEEIPLIEEEAELHDDGSVKKKPKKRRSEKWLKENTACHICRRMTPNWKQAICKCGFAYCYGSLWRGFDMMPQSVMEMRDWKCPRCLKICSCTACLRDPKMKAFEPNGTILGHDTKKFADPRSVESLVDFSHSNMHWVKKAGDDHPHETRRLRRRQDEAANAKSEVPNLDDNYVQDDLTTAPLNEKDNHHVDMPLDPLLTTDATSMPTLPNASNARGGLLPREAQHDPFPTQMALDKVPEAKMGIEKLCGVSPIRKAALDASSAISRLEQDPQAFVSEAGLDQDYHGSYGPLSGIMTYNDHRQHSSTLTSPDGINYEYPDPTLPQLGLLSRQPPHSHAQADQGIPNQLHMGIKRKRALDRPMILSDLPPLPESNTMKKSQSTTSSKAAKRDESKLINSSILTTGLKKSLIVKLKTGSICNPRVMDSAISQQPLAHGETQPASNVESTNIIESDLPLASLDGSSPASKPRKKRRRKVDTDEDFRLRKPHRRSSATGTRPEKSIRLKSPSLDSSSSEMEDVMGTLEVSNLRISTSARRPLPGYLARRSPVDESHLPKELSGRPSFGAPRKSLVGYPNAHTSALDENEQSLRATPDSPVMGSSDEHAIAGEELKNGASVDHAGSKNDLHELPRINAIAANREAKLRAMRGEELDFSDNTSDSDSGANRLENTPPIRYDTESKRSKISSVGKATRVPAKTSSSTSHARARESIFARVKSGKIKITSAKTSTT